MSRKKGPTPAARANRQQATCGLCGKRERLTKTHVPPQCAGNRGGVRRFSVLSDSENRATPSRKLIGGIHFYGLCSRCNSSVEGRWDGAYCEFAKGLWHLAAAKQIYLPNRIAMPDIEIRPGAVARSVLAGCFALNPNMRNIYPGVAQALIDDAASIALPAPMDLFLALTRGPYARVTGAIGGFHLLRPKIDGKNVGTMTMAQIYFPPLAWQLADTPESMLLRVEQWEVVSEWLHLASEERRRLPDLIAQLPLVVHPTRAVGGMDDWTELLAGGTTFVVEGENALRAVWTQK